MNDGNVTKAITKNKSLKFQRHGGGGQHLDSYQILRDMVILNGLMVLKIQALLRVCDIDDIPVFYCCVFSARTTVK